MERRTWNAEHGTRNTERRTRRKDRIRRKDAFAIDFSKVDEEIDAETQHFDGGALRLRSVTAETSLRERRGGVKGIF
jgi:hypothetical protein